MFLEQQPSHIWSSLDLLDERVGKEQHQRNDEPVDRQRLHEGEGQEENAAQIIGHLGLAADAVNAAAGGNALANSGPDGGQPDGEAGGEGTKAAIRLVQASTTAAVRMAERGAAIAASLPARDAWGKVQCASVAAES